jgi:hypothetical protein
MSTAALNMTKSLSGLMHFVILGRPCDMAEILDIPPPQLYIRQAGAYTLSHLRST